MKITQLVVRLGAFLDMGIEKDSVEKKLVIRAYQRNQKSVENFLKHSRVKSGSGKCQAIYLVRVVAFEHFWWKKFLTLPTNA